MSDVGRLSINFDSMNETDVREIVVRPLLHRLGYRHGTDANIRTEVVLKYPSMFLGRKKPAKDPQLAGRADYICEVISYGRWVVEVKSPAEALDTETVHQAHSYAAHPEVGAEFILITNGRRFVLYRTSFLDNSLLDFLHENLEENVIKLFNIVGPEAIRKLCNLVRFDAGKPLGKGLRSEITIIGGSITYKEHHSTTPLLQSEMIEGVILPIVGGDVKRSEDGRIHARVDVGKSMPLLKDAGGVAEMADRNDFYSADEYVSTDPENPTIFQNFYEKITRVGQVTRFPGAGLVPLPLGFILRAYTQAVGYVEAGIFRGTMQLDYEMQVTGFAPGMRPIIEAQIGKIPDRATFRGAGIFEVKLSEH